MFNQKLKRVDFSSNPYAESTFVWHDKRLLDLVQAEDECAQEFFRLLALCHTVMSEEKDGRIAVGTLPQSTSFMHKLSTFIEYH